MYACVRWVSITSRFAYGDPNTVSGDVFDLAISRVFALTLRHQVRHLNPSESPWMSYIPGGGRIPPPGVPGKAPIAWGPTGCCPGGAIIPIPCCPGGGGMRMPCPGGCIIMPGPGGSCCMGCELAWSGPPGMAPAEKSKMEKGHPTRAFKQSSYVS